MVNPQNEQIDFAVKKITSALKDAGYSDELIAQKINDLKNKENRSVRDITIREVYKQMTNYFFNGHTVDFTHNMIAMVTELSPYTVKQRAQSKKPILNNN